MTLRHQSGVALVQVLLISALLLLLVTQLSRTSHNAVKLTTQLKEKANSEMGFHSLFADVQYRLLTQDKSYNLFLADGAALTFDSTPKDLGDETYIELQDMAGLLSTSFIGGVWEKYVNGNMEKLETLKQWQGMGENVGLFSQMRNARIPYVKELWLLPGWEDTDIQYLTSLHTGFFNLATAPDTLIRNVYPDAVAEQVVTMRQNGNLDRRQISNIEGIDEMMAFLPSDFLKVKIKMRNNILGDVHSSKEKVYKLQLGKDVPIIELDSSGQ